MLKACMGISIGLGQRGSAASRTRISRRRLTTPGLIGHRRVEVVAIWAGGGADPNKPGTPATKGTSTSDATSTPHLDSSPEIHISRLQPPHRAFSRLLLCNYPSRLNSSSLGPRLRKSRHVRQIRKGDGANQCPRAAYEGTGDALSRSGCTSTGTNPRAGPRCWRSLDEGRRRKGLPCCTLHAFPVRRSQFTRLTRSTGLSQAIADESMANQDVDLRQSRSASGDIGFMDRERSK